MTTAKVNLNELFSSIFKEDPEYSPSVYVPSEKILQAIVDHWPEEGTIVYRKFTRTDFFWYPCDGVGMAVRDEELAALEAKGLGHRFIRVFE